MAQMKKIRSDMEFMIVTDDVTMAHKLLPGIPAYHFPVHGDYVTVKNARYLIISNSSFACFPAFTSETVQKVIAPKYWARHNVSNGYWASEQNIYTGFEYLGRDGRLYDAQACREELETYRRQSKFFAKHQEKPDGNGVSSGRNPGKSSLYGVFWRARGQKPEKTADRSAEVRKGELGVQILKQWKTEPEKWLFRILLVVFIASMVPVLYLSRYVPELR